MTSSTGGTGALTCTAQTGYPIVSKAFTGTRIIEYSIAEFTDSSKSQLSKAETGIGTYNTATEVLTRTEVKTTWDGTTYLPNPGSSTAPSALSFGTTAANIDIVVTPIVSTVLGGGSFVYGQVTSVSDGLGVGPGFFSITSGTISLQASGTVLYTPWYVTTARRYSRAAVRCTSAATAGGGAASTLNCALYEVGSNGAPGKQLINFGNLGRLTTANVTYQSAAVATPVFLVPGWYYVALLWIANSDTGTPAVRGCGPSVGAPSGVLFANAFPASFLTVGSQNVLNDPATAPTGRVSSGSDPLVVLF
jgi:hypothetical protein